ncbi:MAG: hypothetical protein KDB22_07345 [Planctomycetales bacterium]|nr:hypothetical protein [Planctomycetales bacterium]
MLYPSLSALENLELFAKIYDLPKDTPIWSSIQVSKRRILQGMMIVFWKEHTESKHQFWRRIAVLFVFIILSGVVLPALLLSEASPDSIAPQILDIVVFTSAYFYAGIFSESLFSDERNHSTSQVLLASPLEPCGILLGKWLWFIAQITLLLALGIGCSHLTYWFFRTSFGVSVVGVAITLLGSSITILACSYLVATYCATSLIIWGSSVIEIGRGMPRVIALRRSAINGAIV